MGFLIDTNVVIDFLNYALPESGISFLYTIEPKISIINYIELFSKQKGSETEIEKIEEFIKNSTIYDVDYFIAQNAIEIRRNYKIKLPDAIIAATATYFGLTLVTRNINDFSKVNELKVINPYAL